jgi:hypothetical protein
MKRRTFGKKLFFIGSILTVAIACQPKASNMKSPKNDNTNVNPAQSDNEDEDVDDGAYGDGDTTSCCSENSLEKVIKVESATDVADIKDVDTDASRVEPVQEIIVLGDEEKSSANIVVLEAVTPVEIDSQHQEDTVLENQ